MGNEITKMTNWIPFLSNDRNIEFDKFIDIIRKMDSNTLPDVWVKWKNYSHQIVIETPNYFYKIYNTNYTTGLFLSEIREKLAEIYRKEFNIKWDIITIKNENSIYQIEQREKLQVCNSNIINFDDLMINWGNTLKLLENKLLLPKVAKQLKDKIKDIDNIKLVRDCINKYEDYGITSTGNVILLDDADWFLAIIDKDNNWISSKFNCYEVITSKGYKSFVPQDYYEIIGEDGEALDHINTDVEVNKWIISQHNPFGKKEILDFVNKREQMLFDNIKVLSTGKYLENNKKLYISNHIDNNNRLLDYDD